MHLCPNKNRLKRVSNDQPAIIIDNEDATPWFKSSSHAYCLLFILSFFFFNLLFFFYKKVLFIISY